MAKNRRLFTALELSFLAAIHGDPCDDTPRLVYADWLEENGDAAQADFIRLQCEAAKGVAVWRTPPTSPQESGLMKKYGRRWLGQRLLSGNYIDGHSRFRFQGFHRGLPHVTHFTAFQGVADEYASEGLDLLAPHFQLSVLLRIYCTPGQHAPDAGEPGPHQGTASDHLDEQHKGPSNDRRPDARTPGRSNC